MLTPDKIIEAAEGIGERKVALSRDNKLRLLVASVMAGAFIALGGVLAMTGSAGFLGSGNPSLVKIVSGCLFPVGLILVVILGAELFTGNNALLIPSFMKKRYGVKEVAVNWSLVYIGNFIGVLVFTYFLVYLCGLTAVAPYHDYAVTIAVAKVTQSWGVIFLKGIGANWCVCLAIWLALSATTFGNKALGCWIPIMAFVVLGYEHCIANMFYLTAGILEGAHITVGECLWLNLIPSTIGNIIGGAIFVGMLHTWVHRKRD